MNYTKRLVQVGYSLALLAVVYGLTMPPHTEAQSTFRPGGPKGQPIMPQAPGPQAFIGSQYQNMSPYVNGGLGYMNGGSALNGNFINGFVNGPGSIGGDFRTPRRYSSPDQAWADLDTLDATTGRRAIAAMVDAQQESVKYLESRLHAVEPVEPKQLDKLVADLDDDSFDVRDRASQRLADLGEAARPALRRVLAKQPSLETKWRAEDLLRCLGESPSFERLRNQRAMAVLVGIGSADAQALLKKLASGAPGVPNTEDAQAALQRLKRRID